MTGRINHEHHRKCSRLRLNERQSHFSPRHLLKILKCQFNLSKSFVSTFSQLIAKTIQERFHHRVEKKLAVLSFIETFLQRFGTWHADPRAGGRRKNSFAWLNTSGLCDGNRGKCTRENHASQKPSHRYPIFRKMPVFFKPNTFCDHDMLLQNRHFFTTYAFLNCRERALRNS